MVESPVESSVASSVASSVEVSEGGATQAPLKVLVVDDTVINRQILQVFLRKIGITVVQAENGALGVEAFRRENPDVVIMDVMMPVMDGYEATRQIKAIAGDRWVPVIFLSALDKEENLVVGLDAGGDDYLAKPVNFVVLDAKLRSLRRTLALQRSLDEEKRRTAAISDNLVDGVLVIDERGTIQWVNPAVLQIFGYSTEEMIGNNVKMLMPEPYHSEHDGYLAHYVKGGLPKILGVGQREVSGKHKGGTVFPLDLGVTEMRIDGRRQFVGVVRDTTDRVAAAELLRKNAERLQDYHDRQEAESQLAQTIVLRQMQRPGLNDPCVSHWVSPAANFSGDIVAATRGPDGELYVLLADATGHGLGAAICTLPVLSVFDSMAELGGELSWIVHEVNRQLCSTLPVGYFVAATMLCIDPAKGTAEVWIGGTPELLLIDAAGALKCTLVSRSLPLGIDLLEREGVATEHITVAAGDQFVLFSDGLIEATNNQNIAFGLEQMLAALRSAPSAERINAVKAALTQHLGGCLPHDDVSLLLVGCGHGSSASGQGH